MSPEDKARFDAIRSAVSPALSSNMMFLCALVVEAREEIRDLTRERDALGVLRVAWKDAAYEYREYAQLDGGVSDIAKALDEEYLNEYGSDPRPEYSEFSFPGGGT